MTGADRRSQLLATSLAALAGYVDSIGFLTLGGFFVSFMSGNSTRLAVGLATDPAQAAVAGGLIAAFVLGVVSGSLLGRHAPEYRQRNIMVLVAVLLAAAATFGAAGLPGFTVTALAMAMGAENGVFERDGEVRIGLTYMTGTLVKLGQRLAAAFDGGERWAWAPHLMLWVGLVSGAVLGALVYPRIGLNTLWFAAAAAALLAALSVPEKSDIIS